MAECVLSIYYMFSCLQLSFSTLQQLFFQKMMYDAVSTAYFLKTNTSWMHLQQTQSTGMNSGPLYHSISAFHLRLLNPCIS